MNEIIIAIVGLIGTLIVAGIGLYGAKKYNIGPSQDKLVATLKDIVDAQEERIAQLETETQQQKIKIEYLDAEVLRLTNLTIAQLVKIQELQLQVDGKPKQGVT